MTNNYIHLSKFGYFYTYFLDKSHTFPDFIIDNLEKTITSIDKISAIDNDSYNRKLIRKIEKIESILLQIAKENPSFFTNFIKLYQIEYNENIVETDANIIAKNIVQSLYDILSVEKIKEPNYIDEKNKYCRNNKEIFVFLTDEEKNLLIKKEDVIDQLLFELKDVDNSYLKHEINILNDIYNSDMTNLSLDELSKEISRVNRAIDIIFKKGNHYPFRSVLIRAISHIIYLFNTEERSFLEIKNYIKKSAYQIIKGKYIKSKTPDVEKGLDVGYDIPPIDSIETIIEVNEALEKEKKELIERDKKGDIICYNRLFSNNIQLKKIDLINEYFDNRFNFHLTRESSEETFTKVILDLCDLSDVISDSFFRRVLFDARTSSNIASSSLNREWEILGTLYNLYSPEEELDKYLNAKDRLENLFKTITGIKKKNIYERVNQEKEKRGISINNLVPTKNDIIDDLRSREEKFVVAHAVEEFKYKALNQGKYLNYDLEVVSCDIDIETLKNMYDKIKKNITYTNFVDEIKKGEDKDKKYNNARLVRNKTLGVAQEMIAKTIINKSYNRDNDISYDSYQDILNNVYENILHEKRMVTSFDDYYDEDEQLELDFQDKKKSWDEKSAFVSALYLVVSKNKG